MYVYIYAYIYICIYMYIYVHIYTYIYMQIYTNFHIYTCMYIHAYIYIHKHPHIYVYIHKYIYTHICTYIHSHQDDCSNPPNSDAPQSAAPPHTSLHFFSLHFVACAPELPPANLSESLSPHPSHLCHFDHSRVAPGFQRWFVFWLQGLRSFFCVRARKSIHLSRLMCAYALTRENEEEEKRKEKRKGVVCEYRVWMRVRGERNIRNQKKCDEKRL